MNGSFPLGRIAGIRIRLHFSFLLLLLWIGWLTWKALGLQTALWAVALSLSFFGCIVLHELGHSLVAMRFGSQVYDITLYPIGGVASLRRIPEKPYQEFLMAIAGPMVNLLIAFFLCLLRGGLPPWGGLSELPTTWPVFRDLLIKANMVVALFNLLPAFPMDGGRVLRSMLASFLPYSRATAIATLMGQIVAIGFILYGLAANLFLMIIGIVVFLSAGSEERRVHVKTLLTDIAFRDIMATQFVSLRPEDTLEKCLEYICRCRQEDFPVQVNERLVGVLPRHEWLSALRKNGPAVKVSDIMRKTFIVLRPSGDLSLSYPDLLASSQRIFPVMEEGRLLGLVAPEDISRFLLVQEARQSPLRRRAVKGPPSKGTLDFG